MTDLREIVINCLQVVSLLSAAAFGALALFTNYKEDGKITRYGRIAVFGIVFSLLCSLGMRWAQSDLDRDRSQAASIRATGDREANNIQFRGQLAQLRLLAVRQRLSLHAQLESQLAQQQLLDQATATISAVEVARLQENQNTAQTLHTMWDDANRIDLSGLVVRVAYSCDGVHDDGFPTLMDQGAIMSLRVARITDRQFADLQPMTFSTSLLVSGAFGSTLQSNEQHITTSPTPALDGGHLEQVARFTSFLPRVRGPAADPGLRRFSEPANWRGAIVEAIITQTGRRDLVSRAAAALGKSPEAVTAYYHLLPDLPAQARSGPVVPGPRGGGHPMSMLPCPVQMTLTVNGRSVASAEGRLVEVRDGPNDIQGLVVVKFPPVPVNPAAFPAFADASSRRRRVR